MKKIITEIFWTLILSIPPALSMENDKRPEEQRVLCRTQQWENGQMVSEEITYAPEASKPTPSSGSGMGAWESMAMNPIVQDTPTTDCPYGQNGGW